MIETFMFELKLLGKVEKDKEYGGYISSIPVLDIWSQGETKEEARKNLVEAAELFITSCLERGTLEAVLKECGFHPVKNHVKHKAPSSQSGYSCISVKVPMASSGPCHA